jgi:AcrR family transcriptional regulator
MGEPRRYRPSRKGQILDAALHEIAANGFADTTLAAVANRAGITITAVYYHFESKVALLVELVSSIGDDILAAVPDSRPEPAGIGDQFAGMFAALAAWAESHPIDSNLFFIRAVGVTPEVEQLRRQWTNRLALMASERVLQASPAVGVLTARVIGLALPTLLEEYVGLWLESDTPASASRARLLRKGVAEIQDRLNHFEVPAQK